MTPEPCTTQARRARDATTVDEAALAVAHSVVDDVLGRTALRIAIRTYLIAAVDHEEH